MKWQVNWENDDMDTQTSDSKDTWRRSRILTQRKGGKCTQQSMMISAPSTGRMSSVPTGALNRRIICATTRVLERWSVDTPRLIYAEWVHLHLLKLFWTRTKMVPECVNLSSQRHSERPSPYGIAAGSRLKDSMTRLNKRIIGCPLLNEPTGMLAKHLATMNAKQTYWGPIARLSQYWSSTNVTTDGQCVEATCCKRRSAILRLTDPVIHKGAGQRRWASRYMVLTAMSGEAYDIDTRSSFIGRYPWLWYRKQMSHSIKWIQAHCICTDSANLTTTAGYKAATVINNGLGLWSCSWGFGKAREQANFKE